MSDTKNQTSMTRCRSAACSAWRRFNVCALVALGWLICAAAWAGTQHGTATYRERIALPEDAVFEATLEDISLADVPAIVLGRCKLDPAGGPPFRFAITYDDAAVRAGHRYAVRATIRHQGRLLFTTDRVYPVLDGGNEPLQMLLVYVRRVPQTKSQLNGIGVFPASFEGELSGAGRAASWRLDRLPDARERSRFGRMASTRMFCAEGMEQEARFFETREHTQCQRTRGKHRGLLDATGAASARFEAVALSQEDEVRSTRPHHHRRST